MSNFPSVPIFKAPTTVASTSIPRFSSPTVVVHDESGLGSQVAGVAVFTKLLPFQWKGVDFPTTDFKVELIQDLAAHKFGDLDSSEMEPTGRESLKFSARIPFLNNIARGPTEAWPAGALYPDQFKAFFAASVDRSPGTLVHPHFGAVRCVLARCSVDWKAQTRDGVYVDVEWVETFEESGEVSANVSEAGQIAAATSAGIDLDSLLPKLPLSSFPSLPKSPPSFADFARQLQGVADTVSLFEYQAAGKLDSILFQVQNVQRAIGQATHTGPDASNSVQAWVARDAADRYQAAIASIRKDVLSTGKEVGYYVPTTSTTLPMLSQAIPAPVGDLMSLNPDLVQKFLVPAYSRVRFYAQRRDLFGPIGG